MILHKHRHVKHKLKVYNNVFMVTSENYVFVVCFIVYFTFLIAGFLLVVWLIVFPFSFGYRWLGFFLDTMAAFVVFAAAMFAVYQRDSLTGGLAGLSVSFSLQVGIKTINKNTS